MYIWGARQWVRGSWDRGWWGVRVKYEDQGYIWGMATGECPRNYNNGLTAFMETKPHSIIIESQNQRMV